MERFEGFCFFVVFWFFWFVMFVLVAVRAGEDCNVLVGVQRFVAPICRLFRVRLAWCRSCGRGLVGYGYFGWGGCHERTLAVKRALREFMEFFVEGVERPPSTSAGVEFILVGGRWGGSRVLVFLSFWSSFSRLLFLISFSF